MGTTNFAPFRSSIRKGWLRGTCLNPASRNYLAPRFCLRKAIKVVFLKSGMTAILARPVARPQRNLRQADDVRRMVNAAVEQFGRLDILVNNAGLQHIAPVVDFLRAAGICWSR
jgi:NAD(P)-dependent dehydrogenase (short-subunit alcohol dehydrogenase family)